MDVIPAVTKEIVALCQKQGFVVAPHLATYYLRAFLAGHPKDEQGSVEIESEGVQAVIDRAVHDLCRTDSPAIEAIKLQAAMLSKKQDIINVQRTESVHHRAKSQSLLSEICTKTDNHVKVFGDMVLYILHETGLYNSPNKDLVQRETMTALESVIPRSSIESFVAQPDPEKTKQLDELWRIVWGIRLFNRESHKGGAGVQDVVGELHTLLQSTRAAVEQQRDQIRTTCDSYQLVLSTDVLDPNQRARITDEYVNRRVYQWWIGQLLSQLDEASKVFDTLRPEYEQFVTEIGSMITSAVSVPKSQIYPKFIDLSDKWDTIKRQLTAVKDVKRLLDLVISYHSSFTVNLRASFVENAEQVLARSEAPPINSALLEKEINEGQEQHGCQYHPTLPIQTVSNGGFCPVALLNENTIRAPKVEVGAILYKDRYYQFATEKALRTFVKDPVKYSAFLTTSPSLAIVALIPVLGYDSALPVDVYLTGTRQKPTAFVPRPKVDADTQTGQIPAYKDYKYQWNEWELRRLALKLADLRNKRTKSCQTHLSHFRRDNDAQSYPQRQSATQTLVERGTQPQHTAQYIAGLRGDPESRIRVVRMTFDE